MSRAPQDRPEDALGDPDDDATPGMEIPLNRGRRALNAALFVVLLVGVAAVLVALFVRFTASLRIAMALVTFMLAYMIGMSYFVLRRDDHGR